MQKRSTMQLLQMFVAPIGICSLFTAVPICRSLAKAAFPQSLSLFFLSSFSFISTSPYAERCLSFINNKFSKDHIYCILTLSLSVLVSDQVFATKPIWSCARRLHLRLAPSITSHSVCKPVSAIVRLCRLKCIVRSYKYVMLY